MKIFYPTRTWTPAPLVVQPVASRYTDWAIPAPMCKYRAVSFQERQYASENVLILALVVDRCRTRKTSAKKRRIEFKDNIEMIRCHV
jgi:hypothetical protein